MLEFKSPTAENIFERLAAANPQVCELNLANILMWKDFDHPQITFINNNLCVLIRPKNEISFFLEPIGGHILEETLDICLKHSGKISRASEAFVSKLTADKYKITPQRSQFDYVYSRKDLAQLKGRKYDGKRNHIKKFQKHCPNYEFLPLDAKYRNAALELFENWFHAKSESPYFTKLSHEAQKSALESAFSNIEAFRLSGGVMICEKKLLGFIIGSRLNKNTISIHFSYGQPDIRGIWQILLWEACNKIFPDSTYINLEQDLGIPGLRQSKLSYYPLHLEKKFDIIPA